ncbi:MAG: hypothetical protein LBP91_00525 [Coriobacteriales bacterium]|jgi:hypothetical protein|nr:hypothetical protein [Coriobacteriales bacterium]
MSTDIHLTIDGVEVSQAEIDYEHFRHNLILALQGTEDITPPARETIITQIVQLRAVFCLGEIKGVVALPQEVHERIAKFKSSMEGSAVFNEKVSEFGQDRFWEFETKRYAAIISTEKIKSALMEKEKLRYEHKEGQLSEESLKLFARKEFDDLLVEAVGLLKVSA